MSTWTDACSRARRAAAASAALCALAFGLSRCLLVAPDRDELVSGATASASASSAGTAGSAGSGASGGTGGSGGDGGSGGASCNNVELFWNAGVGTQPGELVLDETDVYWATETSGGTSVVRRKAKAAEDDDPGHVAALLGTTGRFARQLCFRDGLLFWLGRGGKKTAIETPAADDEAPLEIWQADDGKYLAAGDFGLAWATSTGGLVHIVAESGGQPVDGGTYAIANTGTINALAAAGSVLIAAHSDAGNDRTLWRLAGEPPCAGCDKLVPSAEGASALRLDPTATTLYWLTGNGAKRLMRFVEVATGNTSPLVADPVVPDTEAVVVTSKHVLWMTDVFGASFPDEYNEGIFRVAPELNSQVATRLVPAPGCAWTCEDSSPARLIAADADHVYWSCVWQSQAVVYRAPLPP